MYRRFFCAILIVLICCSTAFADSDFIRLHVLAESDSKADQEMKLKVRDACLILAREALSDCESSDAAYEALQLNAGEFRKAAREAGFSGELFVEVGVFSFPDRLYGDVLMPAGDYRALRITLGAGDGHNWWCVLFPTLCILDESACAGNAADSEIEFYSSIGRWLISLREASE